METPDYVVPILVMGYRCLRCVHEWVPRSRSFVEEPKVCPRCKSPYWNRPRLDGQLSKRAERARGAVSP